MTCQRLVLALFGACVAGEPEKDSVSIMAPNAPTAATEAKSALDAYVASHQDTEKAWTAVADADSIAPASLRLGLKDLLTAQDKSIKALADAKEHYGDAVDDAESASKKVEEMMKKREEDLEKHTEGLDFKEEAEKIKMTMTVP